MSISRDIAEVQRVLKDSGLSYTMHSAGTTVGRDILLLPYLMRFESFQEPWLTLERILVGDQRAHGTML